MKHTLYTILFMFLVMIVTQAQSQSLSFDKLKELAVSDSRKIAPILKGLKFSIKKNQVEDPRVADFSEIEKYEYKKETTRETIIFRENIGRNTLNYIFYNKAHYILIKNQVQKSFKLIDFEDDELISTETYQLGNQTMKVLHMKSMNSYSVFLTIKT